MNNEQVLGSDKLYWGFGWPVGCPSGTSLYKFDDLLIKKLVSLGVIKKYIISSVSLSSQTVDDRQLNALVIHYDKTRQEGLTESQTVGNKH